MTIAASVTNRVNTNGNGSATEFSYPHPFHTEDDLVVISTVIATGAQTTKERTTHYTVSGTPDDLGHYPNGGTVTFLSAPASTERITIYADPAMSQTLDLEDAGDFNAENVEATLDKQVLINKRTRDMVARALRQPEGDSATIGELPAKVDRASTYLGFDADGDPIPMDAPAGTTAVSAFAATLLDDATAHAALDTLHNGLDTETAPVPSQDQLLMKDGSTGFWKSVLIKELRRVNGTMVASTSGTAINFTGLPAGIRRITIMFKEVSTNGSAHIFVQLGDAGGVEDTGYASNSVEHNPTGPVLTLDTETAAFTIFNDDAANLLTGVMILEMMDVTTNLWVATHTLFRGNDGLLITGAGSKALSAVLDRIRITTENGTDTFDNGNINIAYE